MKNILNWVLMVVVVLTACAAVAVLKTSGSASNGLFDFNGQSPQSPIKAMAMKNNS